MEQYLIRNGRLILPHGIVSGEILTADGMIREIAENGHIEAPNAAVIDAQGCYVSPGFIDIHTHGAAGYDFMDASQEGVEEACKAHLLHGTTSIMPTTVTSTKESLLAITDFFEQLELTKRGNAEILGLHLEGPYFAKNQRGAQDETYLRNPDPEEYREVLQCSKRVRRWSFAIELSGASDLMDACHRRGIVTSLAHSDATCEEVMEAHKKGLSALTHFYSCMASVRRVNAYRVAGAVEAGYLLDDLYVEVIADGCHLPEHLLQLIYKVKRPDRICLVTDSCRAATMPDGEYILGNEQEGQRIIVEDGVAKLPDRTAFAGSVATMDRLVRTFRKATNAPLDQIVRMASLNPAMLAGVSDRKGSLEVGKDADILIFDDNILLQTVMVRGEVVKHT